MDYISNGIKKSLDNIGILYDTTFNMNDALSDYITDSISFISFIVELENYFNIEISDTFLGENQWETFNDIGEIVRITKENIICNRQ